MKNFQLTFATISNHISAGELQQGKTFFLDAIKDKIPREFAAPFAQLARRLRLPLVGIRILKPYVRPSVKKFTQPSAMEKSEYAGNLLRLNLTAEAHELLKSVDTSDYPLALLLESLGHLTLWNCEDAEVSLLKLLKSSSPLLSEYDKIVAKINLSEAYIYLSKKEEATKLINQLIPELKQKQHNFMLAKCHELLSENELFHGDLKIAKDNILIASEILHDKKSVDRLLIEKFIAIIDWSLDPTSSRAKKNFNMVAKKAKKLNHYEMLRDLLAHEAHICRSEEKLKKIIMGTPYPLFKQIHVKKASSYGNLSELDNVVNVLDVIDPASGKIKNKISCQPFTNLENEHSWTNAMASLLQTIRRDHIRPPTVYDIFNRQFEGQYFNGQYSTNKVFQLIHRLKQTLKREKIPLSIKCHNGRYYTEAEDQTRVTLNFQKRDEIFETIKENFSEQSFMKSDLIKFNPSYSVRTINRELVRLQSEKKIKKSGCYQKTTYECIKI